MEIHRMRISQIAVAVTLILSAGFSQAALVPVHFFEQDTAVSFSLAD